MNLLQYAELLHHYEGEKDFQSGESRLPPWNKMCQELRVDRPEDVSSVGTHSDCQALQKIINKLSDVRNLKDLHLKHYHMSSAQFQKRTTHLHILGKVYDFFQHVVKTCSSCNWTKPRPDRTRVSGPKAEECGDLNFLDHGSTKIGDQTCPSFMRGWTHFRRNLKRSVQMWLFHYQHDMQAFYQMHNIRRFPTGPHTPWPNRADMGVRLFKRFISALVDTASRHSWTQPTRIWTRLLCRRSHLPS